MKGNVCYQKTDFGSETPELLKKYVRNEIFDNHKNNIPLDHPDKSVTTSKIADGAVTRSKIADGAVTRDIIADASVNDEKLDVGAVHTENIFDEAVTTAKLDNECVNADKLAKDVTEKLHDHANKTVLDGITASDVASWRGDHEDLDNDLLHITLEPAEHSSGFKNLAAVTEQVAANRDTIKTVEKKAHTHDNMETLNSITAERVAKWDSDVEFAEFREYIQDIIFGFTDEFQRVYGAMGVTVYDGGIFGMVQSEIALDGGGFADEITGNVDCGGFEPITAEVAVVDGGEC